jgi:hypothetical protein
VQNFSSLASTQMNLDTFLTIFEENIRIFQENSSANYEKLILQSMDMQNFSSLACTQTDFDTFLTIFEENFRIFLENS